MNSLTEIRDRMAVLVGRPELLGFINARLVLRTGITLNHTNETHTPEELARVVAALRDMGYALDGKGKVT